jgi:hypothetical protein
MYRRTGIVSMIAFTLFVCCGQSAPVACTPAPQPSHTGAEVAAVAVVAGVVIGTVVLVEVHKGHHRVKGCVSTGPNGLQIRTINDMDSKTYTLEGVTQDVKVGDLVQVHGSKVKKVKNSIGDQTFMVEKLSKDYGPCKVNPTPAAKPA